MLLFGQATWDSITDEVQREFARVGGKGLNQAISASRISCYSDLITVIGNDAYGQRISRYLQVAGVSTKHVVTAHGSNPRQQFSSVEVELHEGDNDQRTVSVRHEAQLKPFFNSAVANARHIFDADVLISTLEPPMSSVIALARWFNTLQRSNQRLLSVLNPAPGKAVTGLIPGSFDVLVPNLEEAEALLGAKIHDPVRAAGSLVALYHAKLVVITLGSAGAVWASQDLVAGKQQALASDVVDKVGASDCFVSCLAAALWGGAEPEHAVNFSALAAGLHVSSTAASQNRTPTLGEIAKQANRLGGEWRGAALVSRSLSTRDSAV